MSHNAEEPVKVSTVLEGVREYVEGEDVTIEVLKKCDCQAEYYKNNPPDNKELLDFEYLTTCLCIIGREQLVAVNEGGYNSTAIDLLDLIAWLKKNRPELLK